MAKKTPFNRITAFLCIVLMAFCVTSCASREVTSAIEEKIPAGDETVYADITLEGGTGKAYIESPVEISIKDGKMSAKLIWSSKNYDYMIVGGKRYDNENNGGKSTFTVEIDGTEEPLHVVADTVAMSVPHEIEYVIRWEKSDDRTDDEMGAKLPSSSDTDAVVKALENAGMSVTDTIEPEYAKRFIIRRFGDYDLISIENSGDYLLVNENSSVPEGLPDTTVIIKKPVSSTYLASTSAMDLINACGAIDRIKLSGTKESDWYVDEARSAMESGRMIYAGRYRAPDYEVILENGCDLAIENTMIYHEPAVQSKLTELGIPVLVETSSYESHPLGRLEWIKLYGVLFDKEEEAEKVYKEKLDTALPVISDNTDTHKNIAFFHVTANGLINVRRQGDYVTRMIDLAGAHYVPEDTGDESDGASTMNMQMEDFYSQAGEADIIIYNSTIGGEISSVAELVDKNPLFKEFKAVKDSNVYCTKRDLFQKTTQTAEFMKDLNDVANGTERDYTFLKRLE